MKNKSLTKYLVFSFTVVLLYTFAELILSTVTGITHDTVTTCLYAFFGTEVGACAFIKITGRKADDTFDTLDINKEDEGNEQG